MVAIPFVLLMGAIAGGMLKWGNAKAGTMAVGLLFGLLLASTSIGPPIVSAMTTAEQTIVATLSAAVGAGHATSGGAR